MNPRPWITRPTLYVDWATEVVAASLGESYIYMCVCVCVGGNGGEVYKGELKIIFGIYTRCQQIYFLK